MRARILPFPHDFDKQRLLGSCRGAGVRVRSHACSESVCMCVCGREGQRESESCMGGWRVRGWIWERCRGARWVEKVGRVYAYMRGCTSAHAWVGGPRSADATSPAMRRCALPQWRSVAVRSLASHGRPQDAAASPVADPFGAEPLSRFADAAGPQTHRSPLRERAVAVAATPSRDSSDSSGSAIGSCECRLAKRSPM